MAIGYSSSKSGWVGETRGSGVVFLKKKTKYAYEVSCDLGDTDSPQIQSCNLH